MNDRRRWFAQQFEQGRGVHPTTARLRSASRPRVDITQPRIRTGARRASRWWISMATATSTSCLTHGDTFDDSDHQALPRNPVAREHGHISIPRSTRLPTCRAWSRAQGRSISTAMAISMSSPARSLPNGWIATGSTTSVAGLARAAQARRVRAAHAGSRSSSGTRRSTRGDFDPRRRRWTSSSAISPPRPRIALYRNYAIAD